MSMRPCRTLAALVVLATACSQPTDGAPVEERVRGFCGTCHGLSEPSLLPRDAWRPVIERMVALYDVDGKQALPATLEECVSHYETAAPERIALPPDWWPGRGSFPSCIDSFEQIQFGQALTGTRDRTDFLPPGTKHLAYASALGVFDLDGDGRTEVLIRGTPPGGAGQRLLEIRQEPGGAPSVRVLCDADEDGIAIDAVAAGDLDGDGDVDLAVAQTGDFRHGDLLWLEQRPGAELPTFRAHRIDPRSGANAVHIVDFDRDGSLDVVACFGAQFETVVAFLNRGRGYFEAKTLFEAPNADFGCRDIDVADFDDDGDLDVALAAGEIGPSPVIQPFHGIHLLENRGGYPLVPRLLVQLPGAACVASGDQDGDGDLDLVAGGRLPREMAQDAVAERASLVLLEQEGALVFTPLPLERGRFTYSRIAIADADADPAPEILAVSGTTLERFELFYRD